MLLINAKLLRLFTLFWFLAWHRLQTFHYTWQSDKKSNFELQQISIYCKSVLYGVCYFVHPVDHVMYIGIIMIQQQVTEMGPELSQMHSKC